MLSKVQAWLDERYQATDRLKFVLYKPVPLHATRFWYCFGGLTLLCILIQIATGIFMVFYYIPSVDRAYQSVYFLTHNVNYGWLIRSLHFWSAQFVVIFVVLHMLRVFYTKAYAKPRELTWVTGVLQFLLVLGFAFTGYLLPWHQTAYWGVAIGTKIPAEIPVLGPVIRKVLLGGESMGPTTLSHFFALHTFVLPVTLLASLVFHFWMIRRQSVAGPL